MRRSASNNLVHSLRRDDRAVAAVEFAFVGTVFLMLLFALIEFSLLAADHLGVNRGLEAALRYGVVNGASACGNGVDTLTPLFDTAAESLIVGTLPGITVSCSPSGSGAAGTTLTISTSLEWSPLVFTSIFPAETISASVSGVILH